MGFFEILGLFVFIYPLYMSITWMIGGVLFSVRREKRNVPDLKHHPFFSIIIPAHDEEVVIEETILTLKDLKYPRYEVIVVNDGSTDRTAEILDRLVAENADWLRVIHLDPNSGKSKATNAGVLVSQGEFLLVIDADCLIEKDVLTWMAWHLIEFPRVGAVTGNPRVRNRTTLLGKIQVGEYSNIIGLIKRTQRILGKVLTVSGVIAAYRRSAVLDCGLFDSDTVTEDIDITWKLQKKFWDIRYEPGAIAWILVPETIKGLWNQRVRWAQGGVEVLKKHFDIFKDVRYRRIVPVYLEYFTGILWAHAFVLMVVLWAASVLTGLAVEGYNILFLAGERKMNFVGFVFASPVYPRWYGAILGLACLLEFLTSFIIDYRYEKRALSRYYFFVIWYPAGYWILSSLAAIKGFFNVAVGRGVTVKWKSPDRGIHTLKSS